MKRNYAADLLKSILLISVFICHISGMLTSEIIVQIVGAAAGIGMEIFFILSGFFTAAKYANRELPAEQKYISYELLKFYPEHFIGYVFCLGLVFLNYITGIEVVDRCSILKQTLVNLTLTQSWTPNQNYVYSFNGVTWFLSSLFFCYILAIPFMKILKCVKKYSFAILGMIILLRYIYVAVFSWSGIDGSFCYINIFPPYRFLEFACGMCMGKIYSDKGERIKNNVVQLIGIVMFGLAFLTNLFISNIQIFIVIELFLIYVVTFFEGVVDKIGELKPVRFFSKISLSFFIFHQIAIKYITWILGKMGVDMLKNRGIMIVFILGVAILLSYFMNLICTLFRRKIGR